MAGAEDLLSFIEGEPSLVLAPNLCAMLPSESVESAGSPDETTRVFSLLHVEHASHRVIQKTGLRHCLDDVNEGVTFISPAVSIRL